MQNDLCKSRKLKSPTLDVATVTIIKFTHRRGMHGFYLGCRTATALFAEGRISL